MDYKKQEYFRKKLIDEKKRVLNSLNNMTNMEEYASMDNYYSELSQFDNHPADVGTETFMKEQDEGFKNQLKNTLQDIQDSLLDIEDGNYGDCKNCHRDIEERRLETIPYVKTCLECSEELSPKEVIYESIDDKYITSFSNNPGEELGYDREDAFQDLAELDMVDGDPSFSTGDYMGVADEKKNTGVEDVENISQEYYNKTLK